MAAKTTTAKRPLRADAERNRALILEAAFDVFAERGLGATMDDIAERAGVGVGTVYRRFPDKELLLDAVFRQKVGELVEIGERSLAIEDPWDGLVDFIQLGSEFHARNRALRELLFGATAARRWVAEGRARLKPIATELVTRAQRSGDLRPDVVPLDVPLIELTLAATMDHTVDVSPDVWRRLLEIMLDGLRVQRDSPTPLTGPPLDDAALEAALTSVRGARR
jgi:AcrR family transcriptional regulator